jgi:hypothetical protein
MLSLIINDKGTVAKESIAVGGLRLTIDDPENHSNLEIEPLEYAESGLQQSSRILRQSE